MVIDTGTTSCGGEPEASDSLKGFGAVAKTFRERAGLTQEQLAPLVQYAPHTVASIEQGRRFPPRDFIDRAEEVLDAFGTLRAAARHLSRQPGLAAWFRQWAKLEEQAVSLCTYECRVVPGLLQTEGYARAVTLSVPPPPTDEEVEQRVAARLARQALLTRTPLTAFSFVIEQALLERHTGGEEVTRELLDHLVQVSQLTNAELQIMPLRQPDHSGIDGPMRILETQEHQWLAYSEGQQTGQLITGRADISVLMQRYAKLRAQALSHTDSVSLLQRMRGAL
ncbi:helix-turn-helix domain-containing protein [Streptomyces niger]|uniref:helix-turn-helix domain-containing protein n=1 Tax=Streptomyces niger TaxID=66373 RepID=UPI00069953A8|nr:helix-turn-helix transcriptional regulator [Streptomyces niger]